MATVIRLTRYGRRHLPFYRIGVFDRRSRRDGQPIEEIGTFDPLAKECGLKCKTDRAKYWLSTGADVSVTVKKLLKDAGLKDEFKPKVKKAVKKSTTPKAVSKKVVKRKKTRTSNSKIRAEKKKATK